MQRPVAFLLAVLFAVSSCSTPEEVPEREPIPETVDVQSLLERQQTAWNRGDVEAFMAEGYWRSEELTFFAGGDWIVGYDALLERYRTLYQGEGNEMGTLEFSDLEIVPLGGDASTARGRYTLVFADGSSATGRFDLVLRRMEDVGWRIVHDHTVAEEGG